VIIPASPRLCSAPRQPAARHLRITFGPSETFQAAEKGRKLMHSLLRPGLVALR
jgi:hypothetical protein